MVVKVISNKLIDISTNVNTPNHDLISFFNFFFFWTFFFFFESYTLTTSFFFHLSKKLKKNRCNFIQNIHLIQWKFIGTWRWLDNQKYMILHIIFSVALFKSLKCSMLEPLNNSSISSVKAFLAVLSPLPFQWVIHKNIECTSFTYQTWWRIN